MSASDRQTLANRALRLLRDRIFEGRIAGGARLYEVALSEALGLSRTPVREALGRLEQEGLVERLDSVGYVVRSFSFADVLDAIELRGVLEGTVARLAAERGVPEEKLSAINAILRELDVAVPADPAELRFERYVELNAEFHAAMAGLSGSAILRRELERAVALPFASPSAFLEVQESIPFFRRSLGSGQAQHRAIVEAVERRQSARAEAIAREHAQLARRNFEYILSENRGLLAQVPGLALLKTA